MASTDVLRVHKSEGGLKPPTILNNNACDKAGVCVNDKQLLFSR